MNHVIYHELNELLTDLDVRGQEGTLSLDEKQVLFLKLTFIFSNHVENKVYLNLWCCIYTEDVVEFVCSYSHCM